MRLFKEMAVVTGWTISLIVLGGTIGALIQVYCSWTHLVLDGLSGEMLRNGIARTSFGAAVGGVMGFGISVKHWYMREEASPELEEEVWYVHPLSRGL